MLIFVEKLYTYS